MRFEVRCDFRQMSRDARAFLIDAIYPKRCAVCGFRGQWVCRECITSTPTFFQPWCDRCGVPTDRPCRCNMIPDCLEKLRSAGPYEGWVRETIQLIKYHGETSRVDHLAAFAMPALLDLDDPVTLVPVPLHRQRIKERGFNQSALLANSLSALSGVEVWEGLVRVRDTAHQVGLSASERASNVAGAFSVRDMRTGMPKRTVLIDDVFTTGATIAACATVLLDNGARSVSALTIC
jgi:ComF family protein